MVEIGRILSHPEALSVQAMLDAAGVLCHVGGGGHASIAMIPLALGGYRLTVPAFQYADASALIRDMLKQPATFNFTQRRRVLILLGVVVATIYVPAMVTMQWVFDDTPWWQIALVPIGLAVTPVPPQGRGDYYLAPALT
ncbi:MAG: hypothetical protein ABL882_02430 [Sphingopyxis sp.]